MTIEELKFIVILMLAGYKKKTNIGIGLAILINIAIMFYAFTNINNPAALNSPLLSITGYFSTGLFIWGLFNYAKGKGQSGWWALLGFLNLLGLIILVFLPDKNKGKKK